MAPLAVAAAAAPAACSVSVRRESCRALSHLGCSTSGSPPSSSAVGQAAARRVAPPRLAAAAAAARGGAARGSSSSGGGGGGSDSEELDLLKLQQLRGLGPVAEAKLKQKMINSLHDLCRLYLDCGSSVEGFTRALTELGIKKNHGSSIAEALASLADSQPELVAAALASAEAAGGGGGRGGGGADSDMVTLAVEGNISAGKSTFLNVLSHQDTCLHDILKVVQEPVHQWQEYECRDVDGNQRTENVLQKFYDNPNRFAYSFQHYVLMSRMQEDLRTRRAPGKQLRVLERSIFSDRQVFVRAMHKAGTMEDFEVSVYNQIFDDHVNADLRLVPDGFVYLRATPSTCMERLRRRSRSEEMGISADYLELLHANHEDWLAGNAVSAEALVAGGGAANPLYASVLRPTPPEVAAAFLREQQAAGSGEGPRLTQLRGWREENLAHVPDAIKGQVLLLQGPSELPQLASRLALVMDHDQHIDVERDLDARREYGSKIAAFYEFVKGWKAKEEEEAAQAQMVRDQASFLMPPGPARAAQYQ